MLPNDCMIRPYEKGEEKYIADAHRRVYLEEYNWGPAFGDYAAEVAHHFAEAPENPREGMWIAAVHGKPAGCIMLSTVENRETGQIRLFLVEKEYRKNGIGSALTDVLMKKVHACKYRTLILWTADVLTAARRHYGRMGFLCTESIPNHTWDLSGKTVHEEKWEMQL